MPTDDRPTINVPRPSPLVVRLLLLIASVFVMGVAFALMLLPTAKSLGDATQRFQQNVLCKGDEDLQFPRFPERSTVYAANGAPLANIFLDENRTSVPLSEVDKEAKKAVVGMEDFRFYQHGGIDPIAIGRAFIENMLAGHITQGGSTIDQQLVKNVTGQTEDTIQRKIREACLAIAVDRKYTKNQILSLYLNDVYFGNGLYGIGTAAQSYFGVPASDLTMVQAATLAGVIAAPGTFDPVTHPTAALARRNQVLQRLADIRCVSHIGCVNPSRMLKLQQKPLGLVPTAGEVPPPRNPFFVQYITGQILNNTSGEFDALGSTYQERKQTLFQGGLNIYTTLDPKFEQEALAVIRQRLPKSTDPEAAISMVQVRTGAIRVLVSGRNFAKSHQDLVTGLGGTPGRQTGSAFKPFTLAAAFEQGIPPGRVYNEKSPLFIPECNDWDVSNAEGPDSGGYVDLWTATQDSINVVFAQLARDVGPPNIADVAHRMGITAPLDVGPADCSVTLGTFDSSPLDMSDAYATLANNGVHCPAYSVEKIVGQRGGIIYRHRPKSACTQAISPEIASQITAMLKRVVCCGTGTAAQLGRPQAGKTGTNTDYRDAWFVGYVPQYSTAVWVGYPQGEIPMGTVEGVYPAYGGAVAAPIWHDFMAQVVENLPAIEFPTPPPVESGKVPNVVGLRFGGAANLLERANFTAIRKDVPSPQPPGTVIAQTPPAGTKAPLGTGVTLSVSTGAPAQIAVPDVVGMTQADAQTTLEQYGFVVSIVPVSTPSKQQDGIVLYQSPKGGENVQQGTAVSIAVGHFEKRHGHRAGHPAGERGAARGFA
jgi:penicillin-binding protein 1A